MSLQLSPVATAPRAVLGSQFSANRLDLETLDGFAAPVVGFDHFRMSGPTFPPHPHAGFSAVSYLFEDSEGAMHNRDSLGHDLIAGPGDVIWTQAANGVMHEEVPAIPGVTVHGLQLFVNLSARHKHIAPQAFHASAGSIPIVEDAMGNTLRIVSGTLDGRRSPLETAEAFDLFDVRLKAPLSYTVREGWNALVYVLDGRVTVAADGQERSVSLHEAVGARDLDHGGTLTLTPDGETQILILSGRDPGEPVAAHGPFIMNDRDELVAAHNRFRDGKMGRLS